MSSLVLPRRAFIADLGKGAFALAVFGIAGCAPGSSPSASAGPSAAASASGGSADPGAGASPSADASAPGTIEPATGSGWSRVNLGFVSAYVLVRGGEAAIVDTGVAGSERAIGDAIAAVGLGWDAVAHVILTHNHRDHAGSAAAIMDLAKDATGYAGGEDIAGVTVPRALVPVQDGDSVFDLRVVTAPGHTAGSICVLDETASVLVAGDALRTADGRPTLPGAEFTADLDQAVDSVAKLATLTFETLLVGHGEPIDAGAAAMVAVLATQR
ncbi:MAG TPA: MBL fold metallo-hydrolase [Candidatus Limnocylindrales bacterium]|nr:MBL fold metallo-hydrolase [Candidatus Limnocylindrales bacterium]